MKTRKCKTFVKILCACLASLTLMSCTAEAPAVQNTAADADRISNEAFQAQIDYYAALVEDLQSALLKEKEENYIAECEYKLRIDELETSVKSLSDRIGYILTGKNDTGIQATPNGQQTQMPTPSTDGLASGADFIYNIQKGNIIITGYKGKENNLTIPAYIDGLPVAAIGEAAFEGNSLLSVVLPNTVKEIGWFAFKNCVMLNEITIPATVTSVGYGAFERCPSNMVIRCEKGSYMEAYGASWGIQVIAK